MFLVDGVRLVVGISTAALLFWTGLCMTVGVCVLWGRVSVQLCVLLWCVWFRRLRGGRMQVVLADGFLEEFGDVESRAALLRSRSGLISTSFSSFSSLKRYKMNRSE